MTFRNEGTVTLPEQDACVLLKWKKSEFVHLVLFLFVSHKIKHFDHPSFFFELADTKVE